MMTIKSIPTNSLFREGENLDEEVKEEGSPRPHGGQNG